MCKNNIETTTAIQLQFEKRGNLLPVIVQESSSMQILMLGYINQEAFNITLKKGLATFWSTSRKELWTKGETSGDYLSIDNILTDCDQDAVIYQVTLKGNGSCHTKNEQGVHRKSCFYRKLSTSNDKLINTDK